MLAKTDLDLVTDAELEWMLGVVQSVDSPMHQTKLRSPRERTACGPKPRCDQLHARLVSMNVRYQTLDGEGFELSNDDVTVSAAAYKAPPEMARAADGWLRIGDELEVGYAGY